MMTTVQFNANIVKKFTNIACFDLGFVVSLLSREKNSDSFSVIYARKFLKRRFYCVLFKGFT